MISMIITIINMGNQKNHLPQVDRIPAIQMRSQKIVGINMMSSKRNLEDLSILRKKRRKKRRSY